MIWLLLIALGATAFILARLVQRQPPAEARREKSLPPMTVVPSLRALPARSSSLEEQEEDALEELEAAARELVAQELDGTVAMVSHAALLRLKVALMTLEEMA